MALRKRPVLRDRPFLLCPEHGQAGYAHAPGAGRNYRPEAARAITVTARSTA